MNIKSLLFGSAAALVAVSGARAADAVVVAEPEPAEYVRICDVYGAGYFYIPGTETCLRIGGYIRYDIGVGDVLGYGGPQDIADVQGDGEHDSYRKRGRFSLKTWTGQETELGTLRTYTETRFNFQNSAGDYEAENATPSLNFAWIQLGGFRVGKDESAFVTFSGYAGNVIADSIVQYANIFDTNVLQYYFDAGNGFSAVVSLEEGSDENTIDSYVPHVVVGAKYTQGWGAISGTLAYDSNDEEVTGKVRLDVNPMQNLSLFIMGGWGSYNDGDIAGYTDTFKGWGGDWAVWGGASYQVNEKTALNAQVSYDDGERLGLAANVAYEVVPGFKVTAEVDYYTQNANATLGRDDDDGVGGILRFQRNF